MFNFLKTNNKKSGFTLIEALVVIAIMGFISTIVLFSLSSFRNEQALKNTEIDIVTLLNKARQNTLSSINSNNYSVHFETDKAVLFTGSNYSALDSTNEIIDFNKAVVAPIDGGINLGGLSNVTFERLTGDATDGTIIIKLKSDSSKQKTITINKTGVVSSN
jgi:prepilin-type N-terminal cleavage/methylation domain-containing protein